MDAPAYARKNPPPCGRGPGEKERHFRPYGRRAWWGLALLAICLLWFSPAYGWVNVETFDNGTYNHNLFGVITSGTPNQPTVTVVNKHLEVTISGLINGLFMGGLQMLGSYRLMGDFDVQVDFNLSAWPANNGVGAGIVSPLFSVARVASNGQPGLYDTYSFGIPGKGITNVTTTDTSGKLRLKRTGSTVQAFYWGSNDWQSIASPSPQPDASLAAPTVVYIGVSGSGFTVSPPLKVAFDNYTITVPDAFAVLPLLME